jgi:predicted metal-binding membrane protein
MPSSERLEATLRNDRWIVAVALICVAGLAWGYMVHEAHGMAQTGVCRCAGVAMSGPDTKPWSFVAIVPLFLMWAEMMVAMMIPSAMPMILTFARVNRQRRAQERPFVPTGLFVAGYLIVWCGFSLAAALAQWALHGAALLSPAMKSNSSILGGALLVCAGLFQWTPWKRACLHHCSSPLSFLLGEWREGQAGALAMGIKHGAHCTGCCWLLMALLFVAGVMNLLWVAAITLLVLVEKMAPQGKWLGSAIGVGCVAWGAWMLAGPLLSRIQGSI